MKVNKIKQLSVLFILSTFLALAPSSSALATPEDDEDVLVDSFVVDGSEDSGGGGEDSSDSAAEDQGSGDSAGGSSGSGSLVKEPLGGLTKSGRPIYLTTAVKFINNEYDNIDYKLDSESLQFFYEAMSSAYVDGKFDKDETMELLNKSPQQDLSDMEIDGGDPTITDGNVDNYYYVAKSWLISNNVISRPESVVKKGSKFEITTLDTADSQWGARHTLRRSDLYMDLYKLYYGVINSRGIVFQQGSVRDGKRVKYARKYWDGIGDANFKKGDFCVYVSPNVYENYLKALLDKGIIRPEDIATVAGEVLLKDYYSFSQKKPAWFNGNEPGTAPRALGSSFEITPTSIVQSKTDYFTQEEVTMLEALTIIEQFMRVSEKELTEKEAEIITYKYDLTYLDGLTDEEKKTVSFLIAKGVLSMEDDASQINLYGRITYEDFYQILYRVANTDARYDFSKIQLTDSDKFWHERGYAQENFTVNAVEATPICDDMEDEDEESFDYKVSETIEVASAIKGVFQSVGSWLGSESINATQLPAQQPTQQSGQINYQTGDTFYTVVKIFDKVNTYKYNGTLIDMSCASNKEIKSVEEGTVTINGTRQSVYKVKFQVSGTSKKSALNYVNHNLTMRIRSTTHYAFSGVTNVTTGDEKSTVTLVSQTALKNAFSGITILEDKVLMNNESGALACLLPEKGYALVGNTIIKDPEIMVEESSGEVYYSMNVILSLLSNTFFDSIGKNSIFVWNNLPEGTVPVSYDTTGRTNTYASYIKAKKVNSSLNVMDPNSGSNGKVFLYKVNSITKGINTLVRNFTLKDDGETITVTVIVDYNYVVPSLKNFNSSAWFDSTLHVGTFTAEEAMKIFYQRPISNPTLLTWWDSNIGLSNSLANFMYGTSGVTYVRSGYMVPSVTVLLPKGYNTKSKSTANLFAKGGDVYSNSSSKASLVLQELFKGLAIDSQYSKFVNGSSSNFWIPYYKSFAGCEDESLKKMAKASRKFCVYVGGNANTYGTSYGNAYLKSKGGVLYRSTTTEARKNHDTERLTFQYNASSSAMTGIKVASRAGNADQPMRNSIIVYHGKKWVYMGTDPDSGYLILLPAFDILAENPSCSDALTAKFNSMGNLSSSDSVQKTAISDLYKKYFDYFDALKDKNCIKRSVKDRYSIMPIMSFLRSDKYYASDGCIKSINSNKMIVQLGAGNIRAAIESDSNVAECIPKFYLPAGQFYVYKDGSKYFLGSGATGATLNFANFYFSGINDGIIESILANYVKVRKIGTLSNKMTVTIGDIEWKKQGSYWYSEPIKSSELIQAAKSVDFKTDISNGVKKLYLMNQINCDGQYYSLQNYLSSIELAEAIKSADVKSKGIICKDLTGQRAVWKGKYLSKDTKCEYVAIKMMIDDSLLVRPITDSGSRWTICYSASSAVVAGASFPFFAEDLSYPESMTQAYSVEADQFEPSSLYQKQKEKFKKVYNNAFAGDVWGLLKMFIFSIAMYLSVISWAAYCVLTLGMGRVFFEAISLQGADRHRNGIDVIRILTLGLYSLDDCPSLSRVFIMTLVCFLVMTALLHFL